jgi:hypothetical protein
MAAPAFVTGGTSGPHAFTTSTTGLNYPTTKQADDLMLCFVTYEGPASNVATLPGWTHRASGVEASTGEWIDVFSQPAIGGESGSIGTISVPGSTSSQASIYTARSSTGIVDLLAIVFGVDTSNNTAYSTTSSSQATAADQLIVYCCAWGTNMAGASGRSMTQTGATFGTLTSRFAAAGGSQRMEVGDRPITVGGTGGITFACTVPSNSLGQTAFVLLAEGVAATVLGLPIEVDTALALTATKTLPVGLSLETDTALALSTAKTLPLGLAQAAEVAFPLQSTKTLQLGLVISAEGAPALELSKSAPLGLVTAAETAFALSGSQSLPLGLVTAQETALGLGLAVEAALGLVVVREQAQALAAASVLLQLDLMIETERALALVLVAGPLRDLTLLGSLELNRFAGALELNRLSGVVDPNRLEGIVLPWPEP